MIKVDFTVKGAAVGQYVLLEIGPLATPEQADAFGRALVSEINRRMEANQKQQEQSPLTLSVNASEHITTKDEVG